MRYTEDKNMSIEKKIAIGSDHHGYQYKEKIKIDLEKSGYEVRDFGQHSEAPPARDFSVAENVALSVAGADVDRGILICGSGAGMCIAANKVHGCFATLCFDAFTAESARTRNNANILTMGSKTIDLELAKEIVNIWLNAEFENKEGDKRNIMRNRHLLDLDAKYKKT
jgi:ribose 5-phosphate isomerase B